MKNFISFIFLTILFPCTPVISQLVETHEFGKAWDLWYVYSDGLEYVFDAQHDMTVEKLEVRSVLRSNGGTFYIKVSVQDNEIASWSHYVNNDQNTAYFHEEELTCSLHEGDVIKYEIYGGTFTTPVGGIAGINYIKLSGDDGNVYDLQFETLQDMNLPRYGHGYVSDGDHIYVFGGGTIILPWKSTTGEKYDPANNEWTELVTGLIPRRYCCAEYIASMNNIYLFNGDTYTDASYTDTIEIIDIQTGQISYSTTNPYPAEYGGSAVWNDKIYVFGGSNADGFTNRLYEFNPVSNSWTRLPDMAEAKQTAGEIVNGNLYVIGGYNGSESKRIDAYNIQNKTWTFICNLPVGLSGHAIAKSGKYIWLIGSYSNINSLAVFDTETHNFTQLNAYMTGRRHAGAEIIGNDLYIFGGNQESIMASILFNLERADISQLAFAVDEITTSVSLQCLLFPNPCSDIVHIKYYLEDAGPLTCDMYSIAGSRISRLINHLIMKGEHIMDVDISNLPSGIYVLKFITERTSKSLKLIIRQ